MPAILERIKSTVRGRSRSRGFEDAPDALRHKPSPEVPKTPTLPSHYQNFSRPSLENSAFHVTTGRDVRQSLENDRVQQRATVANNNADAYSPVNDIGSARSEVRASDLVPTRTSSRVIIQNRPQPQYAEQKGMGLNGSTSPGTTNIGSESSMAGRSSTQHQPGALEAGRNYSNDDKFTPKLRKSNEILSTTPRKLNVATSTTVGSENVSALPNKESKAVPNDTSAIRRSSTSEETVRRKPVPVTQPKTAETVHMNSNRTISDRTEKVVSESEHLRLPENFDMNNTEETHVIEHERSAVTHETIIKQRTEILQEAITRDIHYHHYFTYVQPIKVVEVLPPKHYFLNQETGEKTEIEPPPGWTMPESTMPISPDYSKVGGWTRHYLVNEEHPNGKLESPPLRHEDDVRNLRRVAQQQAY